MLRKIPGFRSGKILNKIIAVIGYIFLIIGILASGTGQPTAQDRIMYILFFLIVFFGLFIPIANLFYVRQKFYLFNRPSNGGRILGYTGYVVLCFIFIGLVSNLETAKGKALQAQQNEARATLAAEKKQEADDAKAKKDAENKAKSDEEAQAKADAQAKKEQDDKAKADAKLQAEADAKAKADAKAQADAEAKAKAEAEANNPETIAGKIVHKYFGDKNSYDKKDSIVELTFDPQTAYLFIKVFGQDNLSNKLVKQGMWMDISDVLKSLKDNKDIDTVAFAIVMPLQDAYGNSTNDVVMKMEFNSATRNKINWDNFIFSNIPKIAENYWEHPVMQKIITD